MPLQPAHSSPSPNYRFALHRWARRANRSGPCSGGDVRAVGASGDLTEGGQAQVGDRGLEGWIELSDLVLGAGETDLEAFDFAEPALALNFGDPIDQVVSDPDQPVSLGRLRPEERATDAGSLT